MHCVRKFQTFCCALAKIKHNLCELLKLNLCLASGADQLQQTVMLQFQNRLSQCGNAKAVFKHAPRADQAVGPEKQPNIIVKTVVAAAHQNAFGWFPHKAHTKGRNKQ